MIMDNKYLLIGAACAGLGVAYMLYRAAGKAGEVVADAAQAINPFNDNNIISQGTDKVYSALGGEYSPGIDFYNATHSGFNGGPPPIVSTATDAVTEAMMVPVQFSKAIYDGAAEAGAWLEGLWK